MPQGYRPSREALAIMLSQQRDDGFLVRVKCCAIRYYYPGDLITLFSGDMPALHLERHLRKCEQCGSTEWMRISYEIPSAEERSRIKVRRLVEIRTKRIPVWREE
jgi:hypothetical protein